MASNSTEEMKQKVQNWLMEEGLTVGNQNDPTARFHLVATNQAGLGLDIVNPTARQDQLVIAGGYQFQAEQTRRLLEIRERARDDFFWDLRFSLLLADYQFQFHPQQGLPERILVLDMIWNDGLTKNNLMKTYNHVSNGVLFVIWKLGKELGFPAQSGRQTRESGPTYTA